MKDKQSARHMLDWVMTSRIKLYKYPRGMYYKDVWRCNILKARHLNKGENIPAELFTGVFRNRTPDGKLIS